METNTIYTIGHSTHGFDEFIELMRAYNINRLVDIRSYPGSRRFPHFNKDELLKSLPDHGIDYLHLVALGGRRKPLKDSPNSAWENEAFRGYADYMETAEFQNAIEDLEQSANVTNTTMMCSESLWWRCHRSLVSDYMKARGWDVIHIMSATNSQPHPYTKPARIIDGRLSYRRLL